MTPTLMISINRLTPGWSESFRVMSDGATLAFTFHHSEDAQWVMVLESLFESGFYLEATYPIASDEMKGEGGQFGSRESSTTLFMSAGNGWKNREQFRGRKCGNG